MDELKSSVLYYGDNLQILRNRNYFPDNSVDLIYLDPPFNSKASYNILFKEPTGEQSAAQIKAFSDTWHWDRVSEDTFQDIILNAPPKVAKLIDAIVSGLGRNDVTAYLVMMTVRLVELHRVLKDAGSLYLHCDPTASHYLKMTLDAIFGAQNFRNEIIWKRTTAHSDPKRFGRVHDIIHFYTKSDIYIWNIVLQDYEGAYLSIKYRYEDSRGKYRLSDLTGAGTGSGDSSKPWRGHDPFAIGRHWAIPNGIVESLVGEKKAAQMNSQEKLDLLDTHGYIYWSPRGRKGGIGFPQYRRYLGKGIPIQDTITDIAPVNSQAKERLGYPTQKPKGLLERIIGASSNEGDVVLDPFCGCGTSLVAAQKLNRKWIGIDITHLAIAVMKSRLEDSFTGIQVEVIGEPEVLSGAKALARQDRYQFQWWALSRIKAKPFPEERRKGADQGIDGVIDFVDRDEATGKEGMKRSVVSVKSGHVHVKDIRELKDIASRHAMGIFITLEPPTREMRTEAVSAGSYHSPLWDRDYPKIQILTIEELLQGKTVDMPLATSPYAKAPKVAKEVGEQIALGGSS